MGGHAERRRPDRAIMRPEDFARRRILVVGDAMLDRTWDGATRRVSPEAPVPVVKIGDAKDQPGGAANVASNLVSLGAPVTLIARVGRDEAAEVLEAGLKARGVTARLIASDAARTIVKLRVTSHGQQMIRLDFEDGFAGEDSSEVLAAAEAELPDCSLMILSDYGKGVLSDAASLIAAARARGVPVLVDPKGQDFTPYRGASVLTPNAGEFAAVAGEAADEADFFERARRLREQLSLDHLLVTRGAQGMTLFSGDRRPLHVPAHALDVYDVAGAGDTVIATLGAAMAAGLAVEEAVRLANRAAGIVVGRRGTATVTFEELFAAGDLGLAPHDASAVIGLVEAARRRGERIVMTNGCFDVLHAGHVDYLRRARALGDRLVVAVNTDASVTRLKGTGRPVNRLDHRMAVLSALKMVDFVVPFDGSTASDGGHEDTPRDIITAIMPDVLVKGGDYQIDQIVGAEEVTAAGGEVRTLPFVEGLSTSAIVERLKDGQP